MLIFKFSIGNVNYNYKGSMVRMKDDNFNLVLSVIARKLMDKRTELKMGFIEIPSEIFKSEYDNYAVYIDYLVHNKVVQRKPYDPENHICFGYRFTDSFIRALTIQGVIYYDYDKIKKCNTIISNSDIVIDKQLLNRLKRDFYSVKFDLNNIVKPYIEGTNYVDSGKYFRNVFNLYKWSKGKNYRSFSISSNRFYTNFTTLSSEVRRQNILLNNEALVEFDISSSFPKMLGLYCKLVNPEIEKDPDFVKYCTVVKGGTFYDLLAYELNKTINSDNNNIRTNKQGQQVSHKLLDKKAVKQLFQVFLNGNVKRTPYLKGYSNSFIREQFAMLFPCVAEEIIKVKEADEKIYFKLVKIETQFILNVVADLYSRFPKVKVLVLHDAIYVPNSFELQVKNVWDLHINNLLSELPDDLMDNPLTPNLLKDFGMYDDYDFEEDNDEFDFLDEYEDYEEDDF